MADGLRLRVGSLDRLDLILDRLAEADDPRDLALYRELMDGEALPPRLLVNAVDTTDEL